jgi:endonuclease/exonuclease/phosphatase family metal-dependent hydrolase
VQEFDADCEGAAVGRWRVTSLTLLQLNIEYGGTGVDFDQVVSVIRETGAPVVALQEGCGNIPRIAESLGWPYFDNRTQVVSQLPLVDPPDRTAGVVYLHLAPGRLMALINVHPASRGYGPFRMKRGEPDARIARRERRIRVRDLQPSLDATAGLMRRGVPVVLLGDFNAPSHRDWTEATVGRRPHLVRPFAWPTSVETEAIGLVDGYRAMFPDPLTHPGLTWPADRPFVEGYNPSADGHPEDRIDFMYLSPGIDVRTMQIVGESASVSTDLAFDPWPTDHRGLLASLEVQGADAAPFISVSRRLVEQGDEVTVRASATGLSSIVVVPAGADASTALIELGVDAEGVASLASELVGPGRYDVVARDEQRGELARASWWVSGPGDPATVHVDEVVKAGEPLDVRWRWTPGNRFDWVAVYPLGADPSGSKPLLAAHTGATIDGGLTFDGTSHPRRWPLPAGDYSLHLLMDDLRVSLASSDFSVS